MANDSPSECACCYVGTGTANAALYPVERTLLSGGMTEAGCQSLARNGELVPTPHMADIKYRVGPESLFGGHEELAFGGNAH